jgi:hypothetical protein
MSTSDDSVADLADALRRAAAADRRHEKQIGRAVPHWPDWCAQYVVDKQAGPAAQARPEVGR